MFSLLVQYFALSTRSINKKLVEKVIIIINKYLYRIVSQLYDTYIHIYLHCYPRSPVEKKNLVKS